MQHMEIPELLHEMHQYLHLIQKMAVWLQITDSKELLGMNIALPAKEWKLYTFID